jgi:hypothetical protein
VVGVVLGETVIGMEVTTVEPCALVVVTFTNEAVDGALVVLGDVGLLETLPVGNGAVASEGVAGPCATEGVTERERRGRRTRKRVWKEFMAPEEMKRV